MAHELLGLELQIFTTEGAPKNWESVCSPNAKQSGVGLMEEDNCGYPDAG